jgi:class 3 adenylate cyclase
MIPYKVIRRWSVGEGEPACENERAVRTTHTTCNMGRPFLFLVGFLLAMENNENVLLWTISAIAYIAVAPTFTFIALRRTYPLTTLYSSFIADWILSGYCIALSGFEYFIILAAGVPNVSNSAALMGAKYGLFSLCGVFSIATLCHVLGVGPDISATGNGYYVIAGTIVTILYVWILSDQSLRTLRVVYKQRKEMKALNQQIKEQVLVRYLPSEMVEDIFAGKIEMDHEPHAQTITVLFSDLSGFTKLGEQLSPKDYAAQLNEYLSFMNEIIFGNLGTVDKFMGDAIMVMFGAPKQMPPFQQAQRAITCARAMQNGLEALNEKWAERGIPALSQRIGIHQGTAVVGNFGSERRSDYTCIGSAVNLASRIETACEVGKVYVSQSIHQLLPDESEEVGQFELKGIEGKTSLYQVVSDKS